MFYYLFPVLAGALLWVVYDWARASIAWCGRHRGILGGSLAALLVVEMGSRRVELHQHAGNAVHTITGAVLLTLMFAAVPIALLRLVGSVVARIRTATASAPGSATAPAPAPAHAHAPTKPLSRRQVVEATAGLSVLGLTGSMMGWGIARGRVAFELREVPIRIPGLPRALDGFTIVQVSDLHAGVNVGERELDEGLALARGARPDLVVATGDLVDVDPTFAPLVARKLADLAPREGVFACLGNHDYYAGAAQVTEVLRAAGVRPLVNDGLVVRPGDGGGFALLGVDDQWSRRYRGNGPRLDDAIARVRPDAPRILLSHQPPTVDLWRGRVALQLSGHTHGGQINPGGLRPADLFFEYVAGLYRAGDTSLYVNRGFGTVGPPARIGAPPEITRIVLVSA